MSKLSGACAVGLVGALLSGAAQADAQPSDLHFLLNAGYTAGGDRIFTVRFPDRSASAIKTGERLMLSGGVYWRRGDAPLSAQLTYGYHADSASGSDGKVTFDRYPIELLAHYHFWDDRLFLGGGVRKATRPGLTVSVRGEKYHFGLSSNLGPVVELGWQAVPALSFALRMVDERYDSGDGSRYDGKHVGLTGTLLF